MFGRGMDEDVAILVLTKQRADETTSSWLEILRKLKHESRKVVVVDLSFQIMGKGQSLISCQGSHASVLDVMRNEFREQEDVHFEQICEFEIGKARSILETLNLPRKIHDIQDLRSIPGLSLIQKRSIESELVTIRWSGLRPPRFGSGRDLRSLVLDVLICKEKLNSVIREFRPSQGVVFNGRLPRQAVSYEILRSQNIRTRFLEVPDDLHLPSGNVKTVKMYLSENQPHDRIKHQQELKVLSQTNEEDIDISVLELATKWVQERASNAVVNPFCSNFAKDLNLLSNMEGSSKTATFFLSSPDEFVGLDPEIWPTKWSSQEQALVAFESVMIRRGYSTVVRIHPNLVTKSRRQIRFTSGFSNNLKSRVIGPTSSVSSYELGRASSVNFVWGSTLGLELSILGKPVVVLFGSMYDESADIKKIPGPYELENFTDFSWQVNPFLAARYLLALSQLGHSVPKPLSLETERYISENTKTGICTFLKVPLSLVTKMLKPSIQLKLLIRTCGRERGSLLWERLYGFR